jgi:hypothetical protein
MLNIMHKTFLIMATVVCAQQVAAGELRQRVGSAILTQIEDLHQEAESLYDSVIQEEGQWYQTPICGDSSCTRGQVLHGLKSCGIACPTCCGVICSVATGSEIPITVGSLLSFCCIMHVRDVCTQPRTVIPDAIGRWSLTRYSLCGIHVQRADVTDWLAAIGTCWPSAVGLLDSAVTKESESLYIGTLLSILGFGAYECWRGYTQGPYRARYNAIQERIAHLNAMLALSDGD